MLVTHTDPATAESANALADIVAPAQPLLQKLDEFMLGQVGQFEEEIQDLVAFTLRYRGKRLRPILVFFSGWPAETPATRGDLVKAAAVVELVHLATLVHDDILDGADLRHNAPTLAKSHGPHVAVLLGDALFAHALKLAADFPTPEVCRLVSAATRRVCAGEISQTLQRGNPDITLADYHRIVDFKTAELFRISCHLGAMLAGGDAPTVQAVSTFGRSLGIAYQMYDDIMDFLGTEAKAGKTLGTDALSGKFTLPLILLRQKAGAEADTLLATVSEHNGNVDFAALATAFDKHDIYANVARHFTEELDTAAAALGTPGGPPLCQELGQLATFLRQQFAKALETHLA